ncbi:MAG: NADH-quinone oxidoreductase subunit NuoH [Chloroflexi bacterium]|nr:NADH-quinone oxidoreductase subunit NuoH [Chloroflexota bacterium]
MNTTLLLEWLIKSVIIVFFLLGGFAYLTLFERRVLAKMQVRIGPNRAGPWGLLQPVADGLKLIFKEELIPDKADRLVFILAPIITVVPALIVLAVLPFGPAVTIGGRTVHLGLADDINVGVLYILAIASIAVYGITLAGWSSNNKYALMGGLRSSAQMVSYELALGLSFVGPILLANSMSMRDIVEAQAEWWFVLVQPIGFVIFLIATLAEVNRAPFDMPEAEQELTAGYHVEYSGMKFALLFMAEYDKMIAVSAIGAALFLGGYWGPFVDQVPWLGPVYLLAKVLAILFLMIWMRATLPRFRYDRLMAFGWKIMLPAALFNVAATAVGVVLLGLGG